MSGFASGEPTFAVLAEVQAGNSTVIKVLGAGRRVFSGARGMRRGGRRKYLVGPAELVDNAIRYRKSVIVVGLPTSYNVISVRRTASFQT